MSKSWCHVDVCELSSSHAENEDHIQVRAWRISRPHSMRLAGRAPNCAPSSYPYQHAGCGRAIFQRCGIREYVVAACYPWLLQPFRRGGLADKIWRGTRPADIQSSSQLPIRRQPITAKVVGLTILETFARLRCDRISCLLSALPRHRLPAIAEARRRGQMEVVEAWWRKHPRARSPAGEAGEAGEFARLVKQASGRWVSSAVSGAGSFNAASPDGYAREAAVPVQRFGFVQHKIEYRWPGHAGRRWAAD
jgi:hypothetical protein